MVWFNHAFYGLIMHLLLQQSATHVSFNVAVAAMQLKNQTLRERNSQKFI